MVEHLMGVGLRLNRGHAACQNDHRHAVLPGVGDHVGGVGDAGADGGEQNARRARACGE